MTEEKVFLLVSLIMRKLCARFRMQRVLRLKLNIFCCCTSVSCNAASANITKIYLHSVFPLKNNEMILDWSKNEPFHFAIRCDVNSSTAAISTCAVCTCVVGVAIAIAVAVARLLSLCTTYSSFTLFVSKLK